MGSGSPSTFRIPLILLAAANLAILGVCLWPWQEVLALPGNGTTGIDPAISLLAYIGLIFWIGDTRDAVTRKALSAGAMVEVMAGFVLVAHVVLGAQTGAQPTYLPPGLLCAAGILCGIAGLRGARLAGNPGMGMLSGAPW
jgi:hypothetical protein